MTCTTNGATFIGIDLAWRSDRNHTGAAALCGTSHGAYLRAVSGSIRSLDAVRDFIEEHSTAQTVTAVDAPLIIKNASGQRACETAIGRRYGARDASCHTSNLRLYPDSASVRLANALVAEGYAHAPEATRSDRTVLLEVYPHAALVALFDLPKILKYKKGLLAQKRAGLQLLVLHVRRLSRASPPLLTNGPLEQLLSKEVTAMSGPVLKMHEDTIDGVVCAYLAYYFWHWRESRNEVFGDVASGYILNPKLLIGGVESHAPRLCQA